MFNFNIFNLNLIIYGDWGLGIGDWGLGIGPNPQSPLFSQIMLFMKKNNIIYLKKIIGLKFN